ncbi:Phosphoglycerate mutase family protein [Taphrina deformans PYCC 5710]|uniref:Phosphoglycerate mutase family protein n=1 Tax=Taphrina deformans (strain PYCC 5710 / ATCC 11124 / CBS 356.35 / IMI 108563 / JCM 9778 / NBRC 8474) TaxID=1097556 RepID=R4X7Q5_TAPDE|nr:Phosphoglycerate mutase family protein [Taphrina deformans PYCC 5710]|eukprot:CCG81455.1 Phosphoglycerate mutase family protein [Taphrina deformans PYCC 5710]
MSSKVYLFRHGETEWSKNGRHTGKSDLPLTPDGETRIRNSAQRLIGSDTLIRPKHIRQIFVSPRQRAIHTLQLLALSNTIAVEETEAISEWDYGDYEGLTSHEINIRCGKNWNVFRDGCPNGDTQESITVRVDELIGRIHKMQSEAEAIEQRHDVLIVAHGHILRAFAARWIRDPVTSGTHLAYGAGGAGVLGYEHRNMDEPTIEVWNGKAPKGQSMHDLMAQSLT